MKKKRIESKKQKQIECKNERMNTEKWTNWIKKNKTWNRKNKNKTRKNWLSKHKKTLKKNLNMFICSKILDLFPMWVKKTEKFRN